VVRPRLADARFFFDQDRKKTLESRVAGLDKVVYHNKLGTQAARMQRVCSIAAAIAGSIDPTPDATLVAQVTQAARLAKTDLLTDMVGEFPELQGIMGAYYARHDGEHDEVARAVQEHYQPRFAGDALPASQTGLVLALADKLETLAGLFSIGQVPTGDKDPFALRRHALGVLRMILERGLSVPLDRLLTLAFEPFPAASAELRDALAVFVLDRLGGLLRERGYSAQEVDAVLSQKPQDLAQVPQRLAAVRAFAALPQAQSLAAANKRIGNILRKSGDQAAAALDAALLAEDAERALAAQVQALQPQVDTAMAAHDFSAALNALAGAREAVDRFFDDVMVMAEDPAVRGNRLALLARLHAQMNLVADISRLSAA
jgi:glycyl-tRNA synthetase beta chain